MSIRKDVWVCCDNCGECAFPSHTAKQARSEAKELGGWIHWNGKDFCPACKDKMIVKKDYVILP